MEQFGKISKEIIELIKKSNPIIIHRHVNPDGDALGSQWGLKTIINDNFPDKTVLVPGEMNPHMEKFFEPADVVIEKYYDNALVIITDTANRERISGDFWKLGTKIIKMDHHPEVDSYADVSLVEDNSSAACQVVAKWAQLMKLKVSATAAKYLFLGLVTDSGRFLYRSVSSETFKIASFLIATKFSLLDLYETLYSQDLKMAKIKGYILTNFKITSAGVAYIIFDNQQLARLEKLIIKQSSSFPDTKDINLKREDVTSQVNLMANLKGIKIWMIACQDPDNSDFKVSVRSSRWIINETVAKFGGGGHQNAAGCRLASTSVVKKLVNELNKVAKNKPQLNNN